MIKKTGEDLLSLYPVFEEKYLIDGLIENNSLNLMVAPSYTGKTYVALSLCKSIVEHDCFLNKKVDGGTVLYIDNEMKPKYFAKRLRKLDFKNPSGFFYVNNHHIDFDDFSSKTHFLDEIKKLVAGINLKLVVIDSLNAFSEGLDENSNSSMRNVMSFLNEVSAICTTIIIHHVGKGNNASNLNRNDIRGASCIVDKSDNVFFINAISESERCLIVDKARNHDIKPKPVFFSLKNNSDDTLELIVDSQKQAKKPLDIQVSDNFVPDMNRSQLFSHFRENGMIFDDKEMDKILEDIEWIDVVKGKHNSKIYIFKEQS